MTDRCHVLIAEARFYEGLADQMAAGAIAELDAAGATYTRLGVPGCFELPAAIRFACDRHETDAGGFDGAIALGCVIRGETDHYEYICREVSRGLMDLTLGCGIALGFGVLTCPTYEQALERAAVDRLNKGADAARACLQMIALRRRFRRPA
jgi:6,7-dimethyl-8-ribityllumazine synthase